MMHPEFYNSEFKEAIGPDSDSFFKKYYAMQDKWTAIAKKDEYEETRFIAPYLFNRSQQTPVCMSVVANNLKYFCQTCHVISSESTSMSSELWTYLKIACLSGSESVGDFIINILKPDIHKLNDTILPWVAVGDNITWACRIAKQIVQANIILSNHIYALSSYEMIDALLDIAKKQNTCGPDHDLFANLCANKKNMFAMT